MKVLGTRRAGLVTGTLGIVVTTLLVQQPATADTKTVVVSRAGTSSYLVFGPKLGKPVTRQLLAVERTSLALLEHLHLHQEEALPTSPGTPPANRGAIAWSQVLIYDDRGREWVLNKNGTTRSTGRSIDAATAVTYIDSTFAAARRGAAREISGKSAACASARELVLEKLTPATKDDRGLPLSLDVVAGDASRRIAEMHHPVEVVPVGCTPGVPNHKGRYLHNLWHRITRTA